MSSMGRLPFYNRRSISMRKRKRIRSKQRERVACQMIAVSPQQSSFEPQVDVKAENDDNSENLSASRSARVSMRQLTPHSRQSSWRNSMKLGSIPFSPYLVWALQFMRRILLNFVGPIAISLDRSRYRWTDCDIVGPIAESHGVWNHNQSSFSLTATGAYYSSRQQLMPIIRPDINW